MRRDLVRVGIKQGHALADETLGAGKADAALVGKKFAHSANAAAAKVINVISHTIACTEANKIFHRGNKVFLGKRALVFVNFEIKFLVDLVTTYAAEIITLGIEKEAFEHATCILNGWRIARAQLAVDILECFILIMGWIFFEGFDDCVVVFRIDNLYGFMTQADQLANNSRGKRLKSSTDSDLAIAYVSDQNLGSNFLFVEFFTKLEILGFVEEIDDILVRRETHGAEECSGQKFAAAFAAVEIDVEEVCSIELNFDPRSTVGDNTKAVENFSIGVDGCLETDTG